MVPVRPAPPEAKPGSRVIFRTAATESPLEAVLPARTILVAAGTQPNTVLAREDATHAFIDGKYFRALDEDGNAATPERVCKPADVRVLMYRHNDGRGM